VAAADIPKTAVIMPFGLFEFLRMPFGLKNAAQAFQRLMDQVCRGLEDFLFVYLDDILVASSNAKEHIYVLRLGGHGLVVNVCIPLTFVVTELQCVESNHYLSELRPFTASLSHKRPRACLSFWVW
jgi:uncharacterized membrane protein